MKNNGFVFLKNNFLHYLQAVFQLHRTNYANKSK